MDKNQNSANLYWKENVLLISKLLFLWIVFTFGLTIFAANLLNNFEFFGIKLGFFLANQGSILFFVLIVFIYIKKISKLDEKQFLSE